MNWELVFLILKVLSAIGGTIGFFFGIKKLGTYLLKKAKESSQVFTGIVNAVNIIEDIHSEFKPNGGNSIKDILTRIENKSDANEQTIKVLMAHMKVPSFEADKEGLWIFVTKEWKNITGLTMQESIGNGWINALKDGEQAKVSDLWHDAIDDKRAFICESTLYTGQRVKFYSWPITNSRGELIKYVGLLEKINLS